LRAVDVDVEVAAGGVDVGVVSDDVDVDVDVEGDATGGGGAIGDVAESVMNFTTVVGTPNLLRALTTEGCASAPGVKDTKYRLKAFLSCSSVAILLLEASRNISATLVPVRVAESAKLSTEIEISFIASSSANAWTKPRL
jgi:hypothetical protein